MVALFVHMAQTEMLEFGVEQGQMLQVFMRHCQTMKRQETRLRLATAVLLATFFATLVWLQYPRHNNTVISKLTESFIDFNSHTIKRYHSDSLTIIIKYCIISQIFKRGRIENSLCFSLHLRRHFQLPIKRI